MLEPVYTRPFKKAYKKLSHNQKDKVTDVIDTLLNEQDLDFKHHDHPLLGNYKGTRECHVEPDLLLIYEVLGNELFLYELGSHSNLFG